MIPSDPAIVHSDRFSLIFRVDGRVRKNMSVRGHLEILAPVAVATTALRRGTILSPQMITMETRDIGNLSGPCLDKALIVGKRLIRSVRAATAIPINAVNIPPMVKRGQLVRMVVNSGGLLLTATGIARMDGKKDQTIQVQNTSSHRIIFCRVAAPGIVEVML